MAYKKLHLGKKDGKKQTMDEHRFMAMKNAGRELMRNELVHHNDGNPTNNHPDNLKVVTVAEHLKAHPRTYKWHGSGNAGKKADQSACAKLTHQLAAEIRMLYLNSSLTVREIGHVYNICHSTVINIGKGRIWTTS
jgi:hypothetical protein